MMSYRIKPFFTSFFQMGKQVFMAATVLYSREYGRGDELLFLGMTGPIELDTIEIFT